MKKVLLFGGGGLFLLIILIVIISLASGGNGDDPGQTTTTNPTIAPGQTPTPGPTPTPEPTRTDQTTIMNAQVHVRSAVVEAKNNDSFPWYGIIVTVDNIYSTEYRFDDPNYPFLGPSKVTEPGQVYRMFFENMTDSDLNEAPYYMDIQSVDLRAKSTIDGPYDLAYSITADKAGTGMIPDRAKALSIYSSNPHRWTRIESHKPYYDEAKEFLSDYPHPRFGAGNYELPHVVHDELERRFIDTDPYIIPVNTDGGIFIAPASDPSLMGFMVTPDNAKYDELQDLLEKEADRVTKTEIDGSTVYIVPDDIMNFVSPSYLDKE